jgi:uncharacterized protein
MQTFIKNRDQRKISLVVEGPAVADKLAFVMHGLGGHKGQGHIRAIIDGLLVVGYRVVSFDATHTFGESEGDYEDATITNYYADLEDVIAWASQQTWYHEPFVLAGHSLGGICTALFAEKHPDQVAGLAPTATVVSGQLSLETYKLFPEQRQGLEQWQRDGIKITRSRDGQREERLKWSHMEDRLKYDLLPQVHKLTMPVLLVVGEQDTSTPPVQQQILYDQLPGRKELHIIPGAPHTFYEPAEHHQLKQLVQAWAEKL